MITITSENNCTHFISPMRWVLLTNRFETYKTSQNAEMMIFLSCKRRNDDISVRQTWSRQHNFSFSPSQQCEGAACNSFEPVVLVPFQQQVSNYLSGLMESTAAQPRIAPPVSISSSCNLYEVNAWAPGEVSTHSCSGPGWARPFRLVLLLMFTASSIGCSVDCETVKIRVYPLLLCLLTYFASCSREITE